MEELNPYEPPSEDVGATRPANSFWRKALLVTILLVLMLPSSLIAGVITCTMTVELFRGNTFAGVGIIITITALAMLAVIWLFIYEIVKVVRWKPTNSRPNNDIYYPHDPAP